VAASDGGTAQGQDRIFTTAPSPLAAQLETLEITEPFNGSSSSLADFSANFSKLGWAIEKGGDNSSGWGPVGAFPTVNGASCGPVLTDAGSGLAAETTLAANPGIAERYFSLWLDMPSPQGTTRSGYELRVTNTATNTYVVTLSKWQAGAQTVLASKSNLGFLNGNAFAILDRGATVSAWTNAGSGFTQLLGAEDAAFAAGQAGIEGAGNITRLQSFRAGPLTP
jgi:hypothetical protein